jgi:hypothetical protein
VGAVIPETQPGDAVPVAGDDRVVHGGLWLSCWTPSRRLLAKKPISRSAGRWVSRFLMPMFGAVIASARTTARCPVLPSRLRP